MKSFFLDATRAMFGPVRIISSTSSAKQLLTTGVYIALSSFRDLEKTGACGKGEACDT